MSREPFSVFHHSMLICFSVLIHCIRLEAFCFVLFDLILYFPSTIFQLNRDVSFRVEPVLS